MRVKLIQRGKVVDSADCIQRLDFSVLSHCFDWEVVVDFGDGNKTIAHVVWTDGSGYTVCNKHGPYTQDTNSIDLHSHIIPTVRCRLLRLFRAEPLLNWMVVVTPVLT